MNCWKNKLLIILLLIFPKYINSDSYLKEKTKETQLLLEIISTFFDNTNLETVSPANGQEYNPGRYIIAIQYFERNLSRIKKLLQMPSLKELNETVDCLYVLTIIQKTRPTLTEDPNLLEEVLLMSYSASFSILPSQNKVGDVDHKLDIINQYFNTTHTL